MVTTQPSQCQQAPCYANHTLSHQATTSAVGDIEGLAEEERDSKPVSPASFRGRVGMPPQRLVSLGQLLCGVQSSYRPLCPPALPAVSAAPGTHVPVLPLWGGGRGGQLGYGGWETRVG